MNAIPKLIGKRCQVIDNSWAFKIEDESNPMLALTMSDNSKKRPVCIIVSEPFSMYVETVNGLSIREFITVSNNGEVSVVINHLDFV